MHKLNQNRNHYLVLFCGLLLGLVCLFSFSGLTAIRTLVGISLCLFYFLWGVGHHYLNHDLHLKIILEYLLVSLLACFILLSLIWRMTGGNLL